MKKKKEGEGKNASPLSLWLGEKLEHIVGGSSLRQKSRPSERSGGFDLCLLKNLEKKKRRSREICHLDSDKQEREGEKETAPGLASRPKNDRHHTCRPSTRFVKGGTERPTSGRSHDLQYGRKNQKDIAHQRRGAHET